MTRTRTVARFTPECRGDQDRVEVHDERAAIVVDGRPDSFEQTVSDHRLEGGVKGDLHDYLRGARETLVWKLEGLGEYDIRRPLTPTGTNLLGLVKHNAGEHLMYFGEVFGGTHDTSLPWMADDSEPNADMWARPDETREGMVVGRRQSGHPPPRSRPRDIQHAAPGDALPVAGGPVGWLSSCVRHHATL